MSKTRSGPPLSVSLAIAAIVGFGAIVGVVAANVTDTQPADLVQPAPLTEIVATPSGPGDLLPYRPLPPVDASPPVAADSPPPQRLPVIAAADPAVIITDPANSPAGGSAATAAGTLSPTPAAPAPIVLTPTALDPAPVRGGEPIVQVEAGPSHGTTRAS